MGYKLPKAVTFLALTMFIIDKRLFRNSEKFLPQSKILPKNIDDFKKKMFKKN